jgi:hypothetical protein
MGNRQKGEATLKLKDGRTFTLTVNFHAWALTQDALVKRGKVPTIEEIQVNLQKGHELTGIALFWASLQKHHPNIDSLDAAATLMEQAGADAAMAMLDALGIARPDPADIKELELKANPPAAQPAKARKTKPGTGGNSASSAGASV